MFFGLFVIFYYNNVGGAAIKVKSTYVFLDILNRIINVININISEEVNIKSHKSFRVGRWGGRGGA